MRLICPNCDAQYEVDASVIPEEGRDVQCSSCGKTWFQKSATQLAYEGISADGETGTAESAVPEQLQSPRLVHESEPVQDVEFKHEPVPDLNKPDEDVLEVLRQEATRETEARQKDTQASLASEDDIGLDRPFEDAPAASPPPPIAPPPIIEPPADDSAELRDMLPNIEQLNSTLRAAESEAESSHAEQIGGRSGFRIGFGLMLTCATFALLGYVYAPEIIAQAPQSEPYMVTYVDKVNDLRVWLDQMMQAATSKLSEFTNTSDT